jgi:DNA-binding response OmpR family regulator
LVNDRSRVTAVYCNVLAWPREGCGPLCRRRRVIVVGEHHAREVEIHDPDAHYEHGKQLAEEQRMLTRDGLVASGPLVLDLGRLEVRVDGRPIALTAIEWRIVSVLVDHLDAVTLYPELMSRVWGWAHRDDWSTLSWHMGEMEVIRTHVSRLRKKLGAAARLIETRPSLGLMLRQEPPS